MAQESMAVRDVVGLGAMGWLNRLITRLMPAVVGLVVFVGCFASAQQPPVGFGLAAGSAAWLDRWGLCATAVMAVLSGLAAAFGNRWRWPLFVLAMVGWFALTMWVPLVASAYYAAVRLRGRGQSVIFLISALTVVVGTYGATVWAQEEQSLAFVIVVALALVLVVLPYIAGLWVKARREVVAGLQERARRLEQDQAVRAEHARIEERERIAREMHDVLAHRVSLMVLHAGALEVSGAGDRVTEEAALIRTTGRAALTELRQVLGVLRTPSAAARTIVGLDEDGAVLTPQPELADVDRLLAEARAAGVAVTWTTESVPADLPVTTQRAVYRVIQEALTNVVKHAPGAPTSVVLRWSAGVLELLVDSGPASRPAAPLPASGFGLIGLRERVELLRGQFEARPKLDGGFRLRALIPATAVEAAR